MCKNSGECSVSADKFVCNAANGRCVGCTSNSECTTARPLCDFDRANCVRCISAADCPTDQPVCDPDKGECR